MLKKFSQYRFMFEELVKRDFKKKYKRTVLGMGWSVLSPLLQLLVMRLVFTQFFGNQIAHYTTYLFCGNLIYSYFRESTNGGMSSLMSNASIFTKINVPKYLFLLSKNMSSLINFGLTLCVFFVFALLDGVTFGWHFLSLIYPVLCLVVFNIGVGHDPLRACLCSSATSSYLCDHVLLLLLMYMSAIFYSGRHAIPEPMISGTCSCSTPFTCYITLFPRRSCIDGHHAASVCVPSAAAGGRGAPCWGWASVR